jgi:hypothetical protein
MRFMLPLLSPPAFRVFQNRAQHVAITRSSHTFRLGIQVFIARSLVPLSNKAFKAEYLTPSKTTQLRHAITQ